MWGILLVGDDTTFEKVVYTIYIKVRPHFYSTSDCLNVKIAVCLLFFLYSLFLLSPSLPLSLSSPSPSPLFLLQIMEIYVFDDKEPVDAGYLGRGCVRLKQLADGQAVEGIFGLKAVGNQL